MKTSKISARIGSKIYRADGKHLVCKDMRTGKQVFRKAFSHSQYETLKDLDIREVHVSPDGKDLVLLFDPGPPGYKTVGNLARVTLAGEVLWWAELTDTGRDAYIAVRVDGDKIVATSWECYKCEIDMRSGRILSKAFAK